MLSDQPIVDPSGVKEVRKWKLGRSVLTCRIDPTGGYVVAGEMDTPLTQFDLSEAPSAEPAETVTPKGKPAPEVLSPGTKVAGAKSWNAALTYSPDGKRLYASDHTGLLVAWSFPLANAEQSPAWTRQAHKGCVRGVSVSSDGQLLATCGNDDRVLLWSADTGEPIGELVGHDCDVYQVAFHPSGKELVSADLKGTVRHWDVGSRELLRELDMSFMFKEEGPIRAGGARSMSFDTQGGILACGGLSQIKQVNSPKGVATVVLFDWESGKQCFVLLPKSKTDGFVNGVAFHPGGFIIGMTGGASSRAGILLFWKLPLKESEEQPLAPASPTEVTTFHEFKTVTSGWSMDLHPDGRHIVVAHHDESLRQYDLLPPAASGSAEN